MGMSGETVADAFYRQPMRTGSLCVGESSQGRAGRTREGWFKDEILPIHIPQKKGTAILFDRDEAIARTRLLKRSPV